MEPREAWQSELVLRTSVTQEEAAELRPGTPARVTVPATGARTGEARVAVIVPAVDPATNRVPVEIEVPNADGRFLANAFARAFREVFGKGPGEWRRAKLGSKIGIANSNDASQLRKAEGAAPPSSWHIDPVTGHLAWRVTMNEKTTAAIGVLNAAASAPAAPTGTSSFRRDGDNCNHFPAIDARPAPICTDGPSRPIE